MQLLRVIYLCIKHHLCCNSPNRKSETLLLFFFIALSALEPVVYDLFLVRVKIDNKELEAQRMVIVQTLLKLVRYNKVN
jgi:hypothetical protein